MVNWTRKRGNSTASACAESPPIAGSQIPRQLTFSIVLALIAFTSYPCLGFNIGFLDDAPIAEFNDNDIDMMLDTLSNTLDTEADGVEVKWENAKTGNNGSITPLNSIVQDGRDCRRTLIKTFSRTFSGSSQYLLCKDDDGQWKTVN